LNLVVGMKWLQGTYTQRFNRRHGVHGHLFQGRYKASVIDGEEPSYFLAVSTYIHLNPVRAGLIRETGSRSKEEARDIQPSGASLIHDEPQGGVGVWT
jgi:REP element-mobilizing transposase RayT